MPHLVRAMERESAVGPGRRCYSILFLFTTSRHDQIGVGDGPRLVVPSFVCRRFAISELLITSIPFLMPHSCGNGK